MDAIVLSRTRVGDLVRVRRGCLDNAPGTIAVCYDLYQRGKSEVGASFLFPNGAYDGFSQRDAELFGIEPAGHVNALTGYRFTNVTQLDLDFRAGRFAVAWSSTQ